MASKMFKPSKEEHLAVVAIDFGTTFTGFAFSYRHEKDRIYTSTCRGKLPKDRVPTSVLFNPDKSLNSFGFEAEEKYANLEHSKYFYYKWFKMALYLTKKLTRDVTIDDSEGRPMSAMFVFQTVIENLRNYARSAIMESIDKISDDDIQWILTIPAIWSDSARQFMREAAVLAGIAENQLKLVLEPEAASLYCKEQPNTKITNPDQSFAAGKFEEGHKYILADLGGGTADICVHQIVTNGNLRELYRATGDALGATCVDMAFQKFFIKLIGAKSWMDFKREYMDEYLELMKSFESKKTAFSSLKKEEYRLTIPAGLLSVVEENLGKNFGEIILKSKYADSISVHRRNKLLFSYKVMEGFFKPTVEGIVTLLKEILDDMETESIQTLLLVGGFSESPYLGEIIQSKIKGVRVLFLPDGSLAVLKGAVMMGYRPRTIVERKARFSYGVRFRRPFQEGVDPERLRCVRDGEVQCGWLFHKLTTKGEILICGQVIKWSSYNTNKTQESKHKTFYTRLHKSTQSDPSYCTEEEGCSEIGRIERKPPQGGRPDRVDSENHLIVGEAEFTVKVFDKTTGAQYEATMEFL